MMILLRHTRTCGALLMLSCFSAAAAQVTAPVTALDKQLDHVDLGISAVGVLTKSTSGPDDRTGATVADNPSSTVGVLVSLRYIKSPLVGLELNYDYARFTQQYVGTNLFEGSSTFGIQSNMSEYTLGWVFHTPRVLGFGTFVSAGAGTTAFRPSKNGGNSATEQARMTLYYSAGFEQAVLSPHLGLRAAFRQTFYKQPDFQDNYLRNGQRTITSEPTVGFYLHFLVRLVVFSGTFPAH